MTITMAPTRVDAPPRRRPAWPVLVVAIAVAVLSAIGGVAQWPAAVEIPLSVLAVGVTLWAAWVSVRRPSLVVAPLAVCLVALGNPVSLAGMSANVEAHAGIITIRTQDGFGLVFWKGYPGVAGWKAPVDPQPVDTVAFATQVQAGVRTVVDETSADLGLSWSVVPGKKSGLTQLPNGFGGLSMFDRVDSATWRTTTADGPQRVRIGAAARAAAEALGLGDEDVAEGDSSTGDGVVTWRNDDGVLTLVLAGDEATLSYTGGPFLRGSALPGEFAQRMAGFAGLTPPAPLVVPDVPQR